MWNNVDLYYNRNMTGKNSTTGQQFFFIIAVILAVISPCLPLISDKRLCYDPDCSVAIAKAKTITKYHSNDANILSFDVNEDVEIFSKGAGSRADLWGVRIAGKRGYAPSMFLIEKKTYHKNLEHEVPTLENIDSVPEQLKNIDKNDQVVVDTSTAVDSNVETDIKSSVEPPIENILHTTVDQVSPSFEIIDGTTFDLNSKEEVTGSNSNFATEIIDNIPSTLEQPILTVHPNLMPHDTSFGQPAEALVETPSAFPHEIKSTNVNTETIVTESEVNLANIVKEEEENSSPQETATLQPEANAISNELPADFMNNNTESVQENILPASPEKNEVSEVPPQVIPAHESSIAAEEIAEEIITEPINATIKDPISETLLANTLDRVPISINELFITTETPMVTSIVEQSTTEETTVPIESEKNVVNDTNVNNEVLTNTDSNNNIVHDVENEMAKAETTIVDSDISNGINDIPTDVSVDTNFSTGVETPIEHGQPDIHEIVGSQGISPDTMINDATNFNEFPTNRNLLNVKDGVLEDTETLPENDVAIDASTITDEEITPIGTVTTETSVPENFMNDSYNVEGESQNTDAIDPATAPLGSCTSDNICNEFETIEKVANKEKDAEENLIEDDDNNSGLSGIIEISQRYWGTLSYVALTAVTTLFFSLGYYYLENNRRDGQLIAKINKLEKELLISTKECAVLDDSLKSTKTKLNSIEDQSFGSDEMVVSLKADLEAVTKTKLELEEQVVALEKDLESATEAGLELERMLREILATNNADNPLAKSIEDLQTRLNVQQATTESLTNALHLKTQESEFDKTENETLSNELSSTMHKCEQLEVELTRINEELKQTSEAKYTVEKNLSQKMEQLQNQIKNISAERITLRKQLKGKEIEMKDLLEVVKQTNTMDIDFDKISNTSQIKAEVIQLTEEKKELQEKLNELEGAHNLFEEHMKIVKEETASLRKQCENAEKEKQDAETRLQVLSKFFKEKEEERQKEETIWLQQQGEASTATERLQTMHTEIQSYKQQIETLKREILNQEREYKNQITNLESKTHDQWVLARQSERRLEEVKAEASQLRNRLTLIEKNISDNESEVKTHRMDANGETATSPQLFIGAEASNSPIMFAGSSSMPPPYLYGPPPLPPFLPPPLPSSSAGYDVGQRPPPLGGRLSSPPPMPPQPHPPPPPVLHPSSSGRFEHSGSSPPSPPLSPSTLLPYGPFRPHLPPPLSFHHSPPVPHPSMLPTHLPNTSWGEEKIPSRNNGGFHPFHRDQQTRDYKGSLLSSEESLDKTHHGGKV